MKTIAQLREQMKQGTAEVRLAAATELSNFLLLYNEEYNLLLDVEATTKVAHHDVTHDARGIDQARRLALEALLTEIAARKALLDLRLRAVHNGEIGIAGPTEEAIAKVKSLSDTVGGQAVRDDAITRILASLKEIAGLVNGSMAVA